MCQQSSIKKKGMQGDKCAKIRDKKNWEEDEKAYDGEIYMMLIKFNWTAEGKDALS